MHKYDGDKLKDNFARQVFTQIQCTIDNNRDELQQHHNQKIDWNFVFFHIRSDATVSLGCLYAIVMGLKYKRK